MGYHSCQWDWSYGFYPGTLFYKAGAFFKTDAVYFLFYKHLAGICFEISDSHNFVENAKAGTESETYPDDWRESDGRTVYGQAERESKVGISSVCPSER